MTDYPHITVATIIERDGKFLMVKELSAGLMVYNQPAGHLELGETLMEAAIRETLEETAWKIELTAFLGIYHFTSQANGITYVRHCFVGNAREHLVNSALDPDIDEALWMDVDAVLQQKSNLRSPLVLSAIQDYLTKPHYPLSLISPCYE
ncbi:MAG: ADP-ribose pyrophosphatase YjhB (NUDIX family) [Pseudohongiellaceae bacterium]